MPQMGRITRRSAVTGTLGALFAASAASRARAFGIGEDFGLGLVGQSGGAAGLLDLVPISGAADAAYGLIKLRTAYNGPCIEMRVLRSASYVYQNIGFVWTNGRYAVDAAAADAFAATADSGTRAEARFYDQSANANHTAYNGSHLGLYWNRNGSTGEPVLQTCHNDTNTSATSQGIRIPDAVALNNDAYSAAMVLCTTSSANRDRCHFYELISPATHFYSHFVSNGIGHDFGVSGGTRYGIQKGGPALYLNVIGASTIQFGVNDAITSNSKTTQSATSTGGWIGWSTNGSTVGGGADFQVMAFYNRTLTASELALIRQWTYRYCNISLTTATDNLIWIGESISEGVRTLDNNIFNITSQPLLAKKYNNYVDAVSAYGYTDHINQLARITAKFQAGVNNIVVIYGCCWNEINIPQTPAQAYATLQSLVSQLRSAATSAGATLKIVGTGQSQVKNGATPTASQISFWALLNGNHSFFDAFYDVWSDPHIGSAADVTNGTYYCQVSSDQTHLLKPGHDIVKALVAPAINSVA